MKKFIKKYFPLILAMLIFVGFGFYHISKFETIDEHFWKYDRIEKYSHAIKEHNIKKTRINDKPGVTVALLSGIGLPFSPSLSEHEDITRENKYSMIKDNNNKRMLYTLYQTDNTQGINYALRLPLLLFNGLVMLPLLFWLLTRAFDRRIASIGIILIGVNPILIGISQIINPDALLWSFSTGAILAFFALLKTNERKFVVITGLLTGAALLSKYTANLLFIFYTLLYIFYTIFNNTKILSLKNSIFSYSKKILSISIISWIIISIFMPAIIIAPKHFLYATIYSPVMEPMVNIFATILHIKNILILPDGSYNLIPLTLFSLFIFFILFIITPPLIISFFKKYPKIISIIGKMFIIILLSVFILSFINAWFGTPLFSLNDLKEVSRSGGTVSFPQFSNDPAIFFWTKALLVQAQNFVFSLHPVAILSTIIIFILTLFGKYKKYEWFIYFSAIIPFVFFGGALASNVFVNVRYSLILYPIFMITSAMGIIAVCDKLTWKYKKQFFLILILSTTLFSLWNIKPFYFNYTNFLLPHKYVVTDAWGYGFYEAAGYLNSLPNAKDTIVWIDRNGLCQFFIGKCITSREVYLDHTGVDYLLITRRGSLIRKPVPVSKSEIDKNMFDKYYIPKYFNNPVWQLNIDNRPGNFIKIIKIEK